MKKIFALLICFMFIPFVSAKDKVEIQSIELESKSNDVVINKEPTFKGLSISSDVFFKNVGDFVKYKVTVVNNSNKELIVNNKNDFDKSDYIKYEFDTFDSIKPNAKSIIYLTISYNKEIDASKFVNDRYNESKNAMVELVTNEGVNPNTSTNSIVFIVFAGCSLVIIISLVLMRNKSAKRIGIVLILIAVPMMVKAIDSLVIKVNISVSVPRTYKVVYQTYLKEWLTEEQVVSMLGDSSNCYARKYYDNQGTRYYLCPIEYEYEDPNKYYGGEEVEVLLLNKGFPSCMGDWIVSNTGVTCSGEVGTVNLNNYEQGRIFTYSVHYQDAIGFSYDENDVNLFKVFGEQKEVMVNNWTNNHSFEVLSETKFTMPKHDMLFKYTMPES